MQYIGIWKLPDPRIYTLGTHAVNFIQLLKFKQFLWLSWNIAKFERKYLLFHKKDQFHTAIVNSPLICV